MLEVSVVAWIKSMGVLSRIGKDSTLVGDSMICLQKEITTGVLLCEIVQLIFNTRINGIFKNPKTDSTALSNLRKALDVLRR